MSARFTIFIPVHNGGEHVKECVQSVLAQELGDLQLTVLENASTDGTADWLASVRDPRLRVVPSKSLLPIEQNWGRILAQPKNEFMTIFGHDDLLDAHYLTVMDKLIRRDPSAGLYFAHFRYMDRDGKKLRSSKPLPGRETAAEYLTGLFSSQRDTYGSGYLYHSSSYEKAGGMPQWPHLLFADDALWMTLMETADKVTAPEECFAVRVHTGTYGHRAHWRSWADGMKQYVVFLKAMAGRNPEFSRALDKHAPEYFLKLCNSIFNRNLVEASNENRRIDPNDVEMLTLLLGEVAPQARKEFEESRRYPLNRRQLLNSFAPARWLYYRYRLARYGRREPARAD